MVQMKHKKSCFYSQIYQKINFILAHLKSFYNLCSQIILNKKMKIVLTNNKLWWWHLRNFNS